jgi:excisionase family DNA binding protein
MKKVKLPEGSSEGAPYFPSGPAPDEATMELWEKDRRALWLACNQWRNDPEPDSEDAWVERQELIEALQLFASLHGLGPGPVDDSLVTLIVNRCIHLRYYKRPEPQRPAEPRPAPLLVTAKEASKALGISPRKLHDLTKAGSVPCVRVGRSVKYRAEALDHWAARNERRI